MNGDAGLNQARRFDFTAKTDRAVISRTRRITASKTADMESTTTGTKWACGNAVVAARIFAVNGRPGAAVVVVVVDMAEVGALETSARARFARAYGIRSRNPQNALVTKTSLSTNRMRRL